MDAAGAKVLVEDCWGSMPYTLNPTPPPPQVVLLVDAGAKVLVEDRWGSMPIDEARRVDATEVVAYLDPLVARVSETCRGNGRGLPAGGRLHRGGCAEEKKGGHISRLLPVVSLWSDSGVTSIPFPHSPRSVLLPPWLRAGQTIGRLCPRTHHIRPFPATGHPGCQHGAGAIKPLAGPARGRQRASRDEGSQHAAGHRACDGAGLQSALQQGGIGAGDDKHAENSPS